jgi:hypothetical protein
MQCGHHCHSMWIPGQLNRAPSRMQVIDPADTDELERILRTEGLSRTCYPGVSN